MANRTKLWIAQAMNRLLAQKSLDQIRVTEICREADIERPTFYYHFKDKYDLVAWIFCIIADGKDLSSFDDCISILESMQQKYFQLFRQAYNDHSQNALWKYMLEYFEQGYRTLLQKKYGTDPLPVQIGFSIRLYCYGCIAMCREWFLDSHSASAEIIVQMLFASMPQNMRAILSSDFGGTTG